MALLANKKDIITRYGNRYSPEEWKLKKQLEQEDSEEETTEAERKAAEEEFCVALRKIGAPEEAIAKLVAMGPMQIAQKMERGELRFSTTEKAQAVEAAVNAWGRKIY